MFDPNGDVQWQQQAACAGHDPAVFAEPGLQEVAKQVCVTCVVRPACLAFALAHHEWGVWGGLTDHERKQYGRRELRRLEDPLGARS